MGNLSQSHLLQSLGWATLNSFWQMALLWCLYLIASHIFKFSSQSKYRFSVLSLLVGFAWFCLTFLYYFQSSSLSSVGFFNQSINESNTLLNKFLLSASVAYLLLLIFPSYKLFRNWQFVQRIKKQGLRKADLNYRLFVQKVGTQLGINQKVLVYVSELVKSPLTVGYIKPIILLPVAALNHLSTQQVEAILLHELSHIRRHDYLVNFMISIIHTLLYFNPFVKQFMQAIEEERENCCDQLVLQFGYDKVGYASALLTLEKLSVHRQVLALGATGKKYLLSRIENIVGMEKKKGFKRNQFAAILAALFCIVIFNSVLIIREKRQHNNQAIAFGTVSNPFDFFDEGDAAKSHSITPSHSPQNNWVVKSSRPASVDAPLPGLTWKHYISAELPAEPEAENNTMLMNVALNEVDASLTPEQKAKVKATVDATKKIVKNMQWKELDNNFIADAMTEKEKAVAKQQYFTMLDKTVNWNNITENIKANYENIDWVTVNSNVANALTEIKLDSLQKSYTVMLSQLDKVKVELSHRARVSVTPMPDQSVEEIYRSTEELRRRVDTIKAMRNPKKVVVL